MIFVLRNLIEELNCIVIKCEINKKVKKKDLGIIECDGYFLDFFFKEKMIDLEIDGKQHWTHKERRKSDRKRDKLLKRNNYKVYRIKWKSINNEKGKRYIKNEITKFLKFYNGM